MLECAFEPIDKLLASGCEDLYIAAFQELQYDKDEIPLAPDMSYYRQLEALGTYKVVGARHRGELVGYNSFFVNRRTRSKNIVQSVSDSLYLAPEYRRGMNGVRLLKETDRLLREAGSARNQYSITVHLKIGSSGETVGRLLEILGYRAIEVVYSRLL